MIVLRTTETAFRGDPASVMAIPDEPEYLLATLRHYFPAYRGRVIGTMVGLRVLPHGKVAPQERSRETVLSVDRVHRPHYLAHLRRQAHDLSRDRRVLLHESGAKVIVNRLETATEVRAATDYGVAVAAGSHFGRPSPDLMRGAIPVPVHGSRPFGSRTVPRTGPVREGDVLLRYA